MLRVKYCRYVGNIRMCPEYFTKDEDYLHNSTKQAKVEEYERQIDQIVYELYGLTNGEIKIVEVQGGEKMERIPVESSNLSSVGYNSESAVLEIEFKSGGIYQYSGVPQDVYDGLINAASKGKYFHRYIKNSGYPYSKV